MSDLGAIGTEKKEDTLKAQRDMGWSLTTNSEEWVLELERKKGLEGETERRLGLQGVLWSRKLSERL